MGKVINVASLKLCKELYKLSGWKPNSENFYGDHGKLNEPIYDDFDRDVYAPAYDLGYLLRKLPKYLNDNPNQNEFSLYFLDEWHAGYTDTVFETRSATPEDAVAKLCIEIELFKAEGPK